MTNADRLRLRRRALSADVAEDAIRALEAEHYARTGEDLRPDERQQEDSAVPVGPLLYLTQEDDGDVDGAP